MVSSNARALPIIASPRSSRRVRVRSVQPNRRIRDSRARLARVEPSNAFASSRARRHRIARTITPPARRATRSRVARGRRASASVARARPMIPTERVVVVVVVVVIASRPFASRPSRSRRSLDRRSSVDAKSQTSSTRRAVASTIDDRIELNRRSVGRSIDVRVVEKYIDASSIDFRIDRRVVDRFESTSSIDARAGLQIIARGTIATTTTPRAARIRRRGQRWRRKTSRRG